MGSCLDYQKFFFFFLIFAGVQLLYNVVLEHCTEHCCTMYSKVNQLSIYIHAPFFGFPSRVGHHKALSRVACALSLVLISYRFDTCTHACQVPSVVSNSVLHCGLQPAGLLCLWDSLGRNTGVGCRALLQICMHSSIYMSTPISRFFLFPLLSLVSIRSVCLCLCVCFADKLICSIFLASTLTILYSAFLFLTPLLCMPVSVSIHLSANCTVSCLFVAE